MAQNTKKSPPKLVHSKPSTKPVSTVEDLDDEDLENEDLEDDDDSDAPTNGANGTAHTSKWKETQKLPPAKRVAVRLGNLVDSLQKQLDSMKNWDGDVQTQARANVAAAQDALKSAAEALVTVSDDWRPARAARGTGGAAKAEVTAGSIVRITAKRLPEYADVISDECSRGIKVKEIRGNKVVGVMSDGMIAMLPRGHVTIDSEAPAAS